VYALPAYPTPQVLDPTGAGDSFAGGMIGLLRHRDDISPAAVKDAIAHGIIAASFNVEDFSLDQMRRIERPDLDRRMDEYRQMLSL
jgi:sugar/nucleoside kinase (ribokinase family)